MSFYKEILPFVEYIHSIRKIETYLSFDMKFPVKWNLPKSISDEVQVIPFETGIDNMKGWSFVSMIDEKETSSILTKILKIIKHNKEREIKERLFKETVEKLKSTFEKTELDKLQTLYFDFENEYEQTTLENEQDKQEPTSIDVA